MFSCWLLSSFSRSRAPCQSMSRFSVSHFKVKQPSLYIFSDVTVPSKERKHKLFTAQMVWKLFCASGMTHICLYRDHDKAVLQVPDWKKHKGQQATRWETVLPEPGSVRCRSAARQSNVGMTPARTSLHLALGEPASPLLLKGQQTENKLALNRSWLTVTLHYYTLSFI